MDSDRPLDFTYPVACRIRKRHDYQLLFRTGRRIALPHFVIYYAFSESGPSRLGTTVSRKVGNAVVRNRCKRQLREFFRLNRSSLVQPVDLSILARSGSARLTSHQIHSELLEGLARAALIVLP